MANTNSSLNHWSDSEAGQQVMSRLSSEDTLRSIDHLLAKINTLEKAVDHLATIMQQGPGLIAMTGDMVDETYRQADANGVSIDQRLKNALHIAEKLTAPEMVDKLDNLMTFTNQLPGLMAMQADIVDEAYRKADARGVSIDQRLGNALEIAEKLTAPEMVEKLNGLMELSNQLPGIAAMTIDMVDEGMKKAVANGFDPKVLADTASAANTALTNAKAEAPAKVGGPFGLIRALRDPDRQRGLGFLLNFLKHFGKNI